MAVKSDLPQYGVKFWYWNVARWKQYGERPSEGDTEGNSRHDMMLDYGLMVTEWCGSADVDGTTYWRCRVWSVARPGANRQTDGSYTVRCSWGWWSCLKATLHARCCDDWLVWLPDGDSYGDDGKTWLWWWQDLVLDVTWWRQSDVRLLAWCWWSHLILKLCGLVAKPGETPAWWNLCGMWLLSGQDLVMTVECWKLNIKMVMPLAEDVLLHGGMWSEGNCSINGGWGMTWRRRRWWWSNVLVWNGNGMVVKWWWMPPSCLISGDMVWPVGWLLPPLIATTCNKMRWRNNVKWLSRTNLTKRHYIISEPMATTPNFFHLLLLLDFLDWLRIGQFPFWPSSCKDCSLHSLHLYPEQYCRNSQGDRKKNT